MGNSVNVGDVDLYYEEHGAGETIVFIHGLGADRLAWMFQVRQLRQDFRVIALDNRDAGRSSRSEDDYKIERLALDAVSLFDALDIKRAHIVGASLGGAIAQHVALIAPERLATLSLLCTYHSVDDYVRAASTAWVELYRLVPREELIRAWFPLLYGHRFWLDNQEVVQRLMRHAIDNPDAPDGNAFARQTDAALSHNLAERLIEIETPTLVLCGEADPLIPPDLSRELAASIPGAQLKTYPGAGHAFFIEQADEVNEALARFFRENPAG